MVQGVGYVTEVKSGEGYTFPGMYVYTYLGR